MENKETKKVEQDGKIDLDVLAIMNEEDITAVIEDDRELKRAELNLFCEFLSEIKNLSAEVEQLNQLISICSQDKISAFFKELDKNVANEETRVKVMDKISKSHKKPQVKGKNCKKSAKVSNKSENIVKFTKKDVK